jgi:hypothetical protein
VCDIEEIERRIEEPSRRRFDKLHSIHLKRQLESERAFEFPKIAADFVLDTTALRPEEAAHRISGFFGLTRV